MSPRKPASYEELLNDLDRESIDDDVFELIDDEDLKTIQVPLLPQAEPEKQRGKRRRKP